MIQFPIIGSLALATGTIMQKFILKSKKIGIRLYQSSEFLAIFLVMLPFIYFFWKLDAQAFELKNIFIFGLITLFSIFANLFVLYSMKWEKVCNLEPAKILEPLFSVLIAIAFSYIFGEALFERNTKVIMPALIAGFALIFSHIKKHHLHFNKYFLAAIAGSFFFALELVLSKLILEFYTPISFYFLRAIAVLFIILIIFRPDFKKIDTPKLKWSFLGVGAIWVIYRVVVYYGFIKLGVISTVLVLMLSPVFIYAFAHIFLKEKMGWRNIVASIIIIGCVLYSIIY